MSDSSQSQLFSQRGDQLLEDLNPAQRTAVEHRGTLGAPETTREWERLQALLLAKAGKDKSQRRKASELIAAAKAGEPTRIDDEAAKVEWVLVWR